MNIQFQEQTNLQLDNIPAWVDSVAGQFLADVSSTCAERDRKSEAFDRSLLKSPEACELLRASLPREVGGGGLNAAEWGRVVEHIGRICDDGSFGLALSLFPAVANTIHATGNEYLTDRYVCGLADGSTVASFAYTENADGLSMKSVLKHDGEELIVQGEKIMVGGGMLADAFMTYVVDEAADELCVVMLEPGDPGVRLEPLETMGLRSAGMAKIVMNDVRIPKNRLLAPEGGLAHAQNFLNPRRTLLSCISLGRMARTINVCVDHLNRTIRHDQPLSALGSVQAKLGRMRVEYEAAKSLIHGSLDAIAAAELNGGVDDTPSVAKYKCTQSVLNVTRWAFELMGGSAYLTSNPIERYVRDCYGMIPGAGAQDILEVNVGVQTLFDFI